jgi:hypothetical protein
MGSHDPPPSSCTSVASSVWVIKRTHPHLSPHTRTTHRATCRPPRAHNTRTSPCIWTPSSFSSASFSSRVRCRRSAVSRALPNLTLQEASVSWALTYAASPSAIFFSVAWWPPGNSKHASAHQPLAMAARGLSCPHWAQPPRSHKGPCRGRGAPKTPRTRTGIRPSPAKAAHLVLLGDAGHGLLGLLHLFALVLGVLSKLGALQIQGLDLLVTCLALLLQTLLDTKGRQTRSSPGGRVGQHEPRACTGPGTQRRLMGSHGQSWSGANTRGGARARAHQHPHRPQPTRTCSRR